MSDLSDIYKLPGRASQTGNGPYHDGIYVVGYRRKRARRHSWYTTFAIILALCVIVGVCLMVGVG